MINISTTLVAIDVSGSLSGGDIYFGDVGIDLTGSIGGVRAIVFNGTINSNVTVNDFDATLNSNHGALYVSGALGGTISFGDFDIISTSATGTVGIDIAGATGGAIQIGDTNTNGGSQITLGSGANPLAIGVRVDGTTNTTFTLGDGDGTTGDLTASDIHATTAISGTLPTNGTYNFRDIDFNASNIANISGGASFFVFDEQGTAGAGTFADPGTAAQAAAAGVNVLVAIDNSGVGGNVIDLSSAGQGSINTLSLDDNQALISLINGQSIDITTLISGLGAAAPASFQFTNVGGTTTITGSGVAGAGLATITSTGANNTVSLAGSAGIQSVNITNGGTGDAIFASYGAAEDVIIRSSTLTGGTGGDAIDIATTAGASTFDFSDLTLLSGLRLDGTGGGTLTGTATGTNTIISAAGIGLYLDTVVIGAAGFTFDSVSSTNAGNNNSGIRLDTLSGAGAVTIANATVVDSGGAGGGNAIDLTNLGMTGALTIANVDIDMPTTGFIGLRGVMSNGGHTSDINLGTGAGGVAIDGALVGIQFTGTAGVINVGTGAGSGGLQAATLSHTIVLSGDSTGTITVGNTGTASSLSTTNSLWAVNFNGSDATVTMTGIDINSAGNANDGYGIWVFDNDGVGSFTLDGANTIDNTGGHGIRITNASANISNVTFGGSATGAADDITGAGIFIENTDGVSRTVDLSNITMGSGGNGDTADVAGIGIDINSSGAGILTVNLTGTNVIRSTGQAFDVDETNGIATENNVLLSIDNTTFESGSAGQTVEVTGQNDSGDTSSVGVRSFSNNTVIGNGTAGGILFSNVDFDGDGLDTQLAGGTLDIGQGTGNRVVGDGLSLINPTGDLAFTTLNIFNDNGVGLEVNTKGATTTFNLDNAGGTVDTTNGTALFLDPLTMNLVFATVNSTGADDGGGFDSGVFVQQGDASGGAAGVALDIGTLSIEDSTGAGLVIEDSTGTFNFGATTIDNTATGGGGVYIDATGGDTLNLNFTGGLDIDTTSGTGFDAIASIFNLEIVNAGTETIDTTTGRVLNLRNTNAAGAGINFDSLTATGTVGDDVVYLEIESGTFNGGDVIIAGTAGINDNGIQIIQGDGAASVNFASATIDNVAGTAIVSSFDGTATFTTVDIDGGRSAVVHTGNGTLNIDDGSIGASTSTSSRSIFLQSGAGNVNIAATVTKSTAGELVRIFGRSGGTVTLSRNLTATGAATGIYMSNNTGGTTTFSGATKTLNTGTNAAVTLDNNTGATINFTGGGLDIDTTSGTGFTATGGGTVNVSGGVNTVNTATGQILNWDGITVGGSGVTFASLTATGVVTGGDGILLNNVDGGTLNGGNVTIAGTTGAGNHGVEIAGGSVATMQFGTVRVDGSVNGNGIFVTGGGNGDITIGSVDIDGAGASGIFLNGHTGTFTVNGGTIGATTTNGTGVAISSGDNTVAIAADITSSAGAVTHGVLVQNRTGGTVTFSGAINDTVGGIGVQNNTGGTITFSGATKTLNTGVNAAVTLTNNTGATINFTGGALDIDTTSGTGFVYNAGGTVNVTDLMTIDAAGTGAGLSVLNDGTGSFTANNAGNTIATVSGLALEISTSTVNATFNSVSASALNGNHGIYGFEHSGTLTVNGGTLTNLGNQAAIDISGGSGTITVASNINSTGAIGLALGVDTRTGGTFTYSGNLIDDAAQGGGIDLNNNTAGTINISGTSKVVNTGAATGVRLFLNSGTSTVNFTNGGLDIDTTSGTGFIATGGGTVNVSGAGNTITTTSGTLIDSSDVASVTFGATFASASASALNGNNGIDLRNASGTLTISGGTITNNGIGAAVRLLEGNATINLTTNVVSAGLGAAVNIQNLTGGANTFSGVFSDTNANGGQMLFSGNTGGSTSFGGNVTLDTGGSIALALINSAAHAVTFSGTNTVLSTTSANVVDISNGATVNFNSTGTNTITATGSGKGIEANGGGTVVIGGTANVTSATGTAVDIQNTTIGAAGVTFESVSAGNGSSNAIILDSTGASGGLRITGVGTTDGSGGTIGNRTGADGSTAEGSAIYLNNTFDAQFANMTLSGVYDNHAILGSGVNGLTLTNVDVTGPSGTNVVADEGGVELNGITGTLTVTSGTYGGGVEDNFAINNSSGTLTANFTGVTFAANNATTGDNGLQFITTGSATANLSVQDSSFTGARSVQLFVNMDGTGGGTVNIGGTTGNAFTMNQAALVGGGAIEVTATGTGNTATVNTTVSNNTIVAGSNTYEGDVIVLGTGFGFAGTHNMTIDNNTIGTNGVNGSAVNPAAGSGDSGIVISQNGTGTINALINNNRIYDYNASGIEIIYDAEGPSNPSGGNINVTITNNIVQDQVGTAGFANAPLFILGDDDVDACFNINGNTLSNPGGEELIVDVLAPTGSGAIFGVVGLGMLSEAGIDAHWTANNGGAGVDIRLDADNSIQAPVSCTLP